MFLDHMRYQRLIVDQTFVSSAALIIYDHILTFRREIEFVWHSPWTYTKVLFLLIRYTALVEASIFTISKFSLNEIVLNMLDFICRPNVLGHVSRIV